MSSLLHYAEIVDEAARTAKAIPQFTTSAPLGLEEAYAVQALSLERRFCTRREARSESKMGLTSRAKMIQVGVDEVIWGRLTDAMRLEEGGSLSKKRYVHPRIEPELAFLMKRELSGEVSAAEALSAVEAIAPAMEIIDSRYENFKFALPDVIADNSSSSGFVVGNWARPDQDFSNLGIVVEVDGRAGPDRLDGGDPRPPHPFARRGGAGGGQHRRPEARLDRACRRRHRRAPARASASMCAPSCRTSVRSRSASRSNTCPSSKSH